jgi:hypothetical protein
LVTFLNHIRDIGFSNIEFHRDKRQTFLWLVLWVGVKTFMKKVNDLKTILIQ